MNWSRPSAVEYAQLAHYNVRDCGVTYRNAICCILKQVFIIRLNDSKVIE